MGVSVVAEESVVSTKVETLLKSAKWDVGVVVGQYSAKKYHIVALISTPELDQGSDPSKGVDAVDENFFGNHARAIPKHLVGGLHVLGIYIFAPAKVDTGTKGKKLLMQACAGSKDSWGVFGPSDSDAKEYLIINIDASSRRISCKSLNVDDYKANLRPATWSTHPFLSSWHTIKASFNAQLSFPMKVDNGKSEENCADWVSRASEIGIKPVVKRIKSAAAFLDEVLANEDGQPFEAKGKKAKTKEHKVEFYATPTSNPNYSMTDSSVTHSIDLNGMISSFVIMSPKASHKEGVREVKVDLIRSIDARLHTLREELEETTLSNPQGANHALQLPSRVLVTTATNMHYCDYMLPVDTLDDVVLNLKELFGLEDVTQHQLRNLEKFAPKQSFPTKKPSGAATKANSSGSNSTATGTASAGGNTTIILGAVFVALLAILWSVLKS